MLQTKEKELIQKTLKEVTSLLQNREPLNKDFSSEDLELVYSLAISLHHAGEVTQAGEIFHQLALSSPLVEKYWKGLGLCLQSENKWGKAAKAWKMATLVEKKEPLSFLHLAECCFSMSDFEEGCKALKTAKDLEGKGSSEVTRKILYLENTWLKQEKEGA